MPPWPRSAVDEAATASFLLASAEWTRIGKSHGRTRGSRRFRWRSAPEPLLPRGDAPTTPLVDPRPEGWRDRRPRKISALLRPPLHNPRLEHGEEWSNCHADPVASGSISNSRVSVPMVRNVSETACREWEGRLAGAPRHGRRVGSSGRCADSHDTARRMPSPRFVRRALTGKARDGRPLGVFSPQAGWRSAVDFLAATRTTSCPIGHRGRASSCSKCTIRRATFPRSWPRRTRFHEAETARVWCR